MKNQPDQHRLDTVIHTLWSDVAVAEVLLTFVSSHWTFLGIKANILDHASWDWPSPESLLWVVKDGRGLKLWQPWIHAAHTLTRIHEREIEAVIGHHEHMDELYVAVKWVGHDCPTWEIESSHSHSQKLTEYWASICRP
jgi:hypothetical protein